MTDEQLTRIKPERSMPTENIMIMIELLNPINKFELLKVNKSMRELRHHVYAKDNLEKLICMFVKNP
jgi:hypothetical protein